LLHKEQPFFFDVQVGQTAAMIAGYATGVEEIELGYNAATTVIDLGVEYYKDK